MGRVLTSGSVGGGLVNTLERNARDVGSIPTVGILSHPMTYIIHLYIYIYIYIYSHTIYSLYVLIPALVTIFHLFIMLQDIYTHVHYMAFP